jgi:hypothetical protein
MQHANGLKRKQAAAAIAVPPEVVRRRRSLAFWGTRQGYWSPAVGKLGAALASAIPLDMVPDTTDGWRRYVRGVGVSLGLEVAL